MRAVQIACVQAVALYGSQLWWDPKDVSRRDDLQLLLNRQARSNLGALPTTPRGALIRDSGLTPAAVALDARQQRFVARLASACEGSKSNKLYDYPTPGAPVGRVATSEHARGRRTETMRWPDSGEKPAVKTTILEEDAAAKRAADRWVREKERQAGIWHLDVVDRRISYGRWESGSRCTLLKLRRVDDLPQLPRHRTNGSVRRRIVGNRSRPPKVCCMSGGATSTRSHHSGNL